MHTLHGKQIMLSFALTVDNVDENARRMSIAWDASVVSRVGLLYIVDDQHARGFRVGHINVPAWVVVYHSETLLRKKERVK